MWNTHRLPILGRVGVLSAALGVLFSGILITPSVAETGDSAKSTQVAQARSDEYLPPWQRSNRNAQQPQRNDEQPQQISPSRGESANTYDSSRGNPPRAERARDRDDGPPPSRREYARPTYEDETYSSSEIINAGHHFFGGVTKGLGTVVEHAFQKQGRPNGYILGEEGGGALVAGLRYGQGTLYTKHNGSRRVYWQGPSLGYDFGAEGSKTLILVYNLHDFDQLYHRFAGVDGSAYFVGGVGITFQAYDDVVLAPIRSGVGIRLGANVGYLKYTRTPTWNPF